MTQRRLTTGWAVVLALGLAGCAVGYGDRLRAWREAAPLPFTQATRAWLADVDRASTPTGTLVPTPPIGTTAALDSTASAELDVLAAVLGEPPQRLATRVHAWADPSARDRALAERVEWDGLRLAVAATNPSVRAARAMWQATLQQYMQADYLEGIAAPYRALGALLRRDAGDPMAGSMSGPIAPYPGATALRGELIRVQARLARLAWERALRDALVEAGEAFARYQYVARAEATARANVALTEDLVAVIDQRVRSGSAQQFDLIKAQIELERRRVELADLQSERARAAAQLNGLLDRPADAPLGPPGDADFVAPDAPLEELTRRALDGRQEVAIQAARAARVPIAIRLGEVMGRPQAGAALGVVDPLELSRNGEAAEAMDVMGGTDEMTGGAAAETRPDFALNEAYLAEMRRMADAEAAMLDAMRAETRAMVRQWMADGTIARRREAFLRETVLPQSRSAYDSALSAYIAGAAGFIDLLDAERALLYARLEWDAARRDLNLVALRGAALLGRVPAGE